MRYIASSSLSNSSSWIDEEASELVPHYVWIGFGMLFACFTIIVNLCTILLLLKHRPMQKSISNLYILSLSFADLAIGCLILMVVAAQFFDSRILAHVPWLCDLWQVSDFVLSTISLYSICAIAFDRVWNLEKPLRVLKRSRRLARRIIIAIWLIPPVIWIPFFFVFTEREENSTVYGLPNCTAAYRSNLLAVVVAVPMMYLPAIALVAMFVRISIVVHGHFSFLKEHSNNPLSTPLYNNSARGSKDSTPFTRTPEQTKKHSETSMTSVSPYGSMRSPRSQSPRYQRPELAPLSEERSSGRERSFSEQLPRIEQFDVDSSNHLRVKSTASNPTRKESLRMRQMMINQKGENVVVGKSRSSSVCRGSFRRVSNASNSSRSKRFSVIAIPNLADFLQRDGGMSQQVRAAKAVFLILFCFLMCWLPFLVMWPIKLYGGDVISPTVYNIGVWLNYLCSALNPLLYTLSSPRVRVILGGYCGFFCQDTKSRMKQSYFVKSGTLV